jgi:hypothetical protein
MSLIGLIGFDPLQILYRNLDKIINRVSNLSNLSIFIFLIKNIKLIRSAP